MTIRKVKTGWQVNIQPGGRSGRRVKKTFKLKADALAWERYIQAQVQETPDWEPPKKEKRLLSDLCEQWYQHHGVGLKDGKGRLSKLINLCEALGNPRADLFTADMFTEYRTQRLEQGISANNLNHEHAYLRAVFNELIRIGSWKRDNPLKLLRALKVEERELSYLDLEKLKKLLDALAESENVHCLLISKVCLATGARWGEAEGLRISQVGNGVIQFVKTKSSKNRAVPIDSRLETELLLHYEKYGDDERIFDRAFYAFRGAVERAGIVLPKGQLTHVLRHSFASHFMMNGGSILALQRVLGHHSLSMTIRYAHLSPDHLAETKELNPLLLLQKIGESNGI